MKVGENEELVDQIKKYKEKEKMLYEEISRLKNKNMSLEAKVNKNDVQKELIMKDISYSNLSLFKNYNSAQIKFSDVVKTLFYLKD